MVHKMMRCKHLDVVDSNALLGYKNLKLHIHHFPVMDVWNVIMRNIDKKSKDNGVGFK